MGNRIFLFLIEFLVESEPLQRKSAIVFSKVFNISSNTRSFAMLFAGFKFAILKNLFFRESGRRSRTNKTTISRIFGQSRCCCFCCDKDSSEEDEERNTRTYLSSKNIAMPRKPLSNKQFFLEHSLHFPLQFLLSSFFLLSAEALVHSPPYFVPPQKKISSVAREQN